MREVDIRQIAVNNHIYNLKSQELANKQASTSIDLHTNSNDKDTLVAIKKYVESGAYILNFVPILEKIFSLAIFEEGFLNFLKKSYLSDKISYTTASFNLLLQDALNVIYRREKVSFDKYSYLLLEKQENVVTSDSQLNKELDLKLPADAKMLTPYDEVITIINVIGWNGLAQMLDLIYKVNIQTTRR